MKVFKQMNEQAVNQFIWESHFLKLKRLVKVFNVFIFCSEPTGSRSASGRGRQAPYLASYCTSLALQCCLHSERPEDLLSLSPNFSRVLHKPSVRGKETISFLLFFNIAWFFIATFYTSLTSAIWLSFKKRMLSNSGRVMLRSLKQLD